MILETPRCRLFMSLARYADHGLFSPQDRGHVTHDKRGIARTTVLGKDAIQRKDRIRSDKTQRRPREVAEIVNKVEPFFGSALMTYAWYRSEPLPGLTPESSTRPNGRTSVPDKVLLDGAFSSIANKRCPFGCA